MTYQFKTNYILKYSKAERNLLKLLTSNSSMSVSTTNTSINKY